MSPEQNNNLPGLENKEKLTSIDNIKQNIQGRLDYLSKIDINSDSINRLKDFIKEYINDKEALEIILVGLDEIVEEVSLIGTKGKKDISKIIEGMAKSLEESEKERELE